MIIDVSRDDALSKYVCDIIAGAQNVGHDQLEWKSSGDFAYRLRDIDSGVVRLGEEQRNDNGGGVANVGEPPCGGTQVRLSQVKIRGNSRDLGLLGDSSH